MIYFSSQVVHVCSGGKSFSFLFPAVISLVMCTGQPVAPAPSFRLCSVNPSRSGLERIRKNFDLGGI